MPQSFQPCPENRAKVMAAIPCFNTESFIADVVCKVRKYVDQVIVVDDGSYDGTAKAARGDDVLVISCAKNLGKGAAMKIAAEATSDADVIVFLDGDGQHDPEDIPKVIAPILQNGADLVIGSRFLRESKVSKSSVPRRLSNAAASFIISIVISFLLPLAILLNHLIGSKKSLVSSPQSRAEASNPECLTQNSQLGTKKWITDCTSGFRAIRKDEWFKLDLDSQGFEIETEMIYEAVKSKLAIAEVPISCSWNIQLSHLSIFRDGLKTLKLLVEKLVGEIRGR